MAQRILVVDDLSEVGLSVLRRAGHDVVRRLDLSEDEFKKILPDFDVLLVRSRTRVDSSIFAAASGLKLVGRAGFGIDSIDLKAATQAGVVVMHCDAGNAVSAAEFAIGMLFCLARHIPQADASLRSGRWDKRRYRGVELSGKVLGVVGMGRVGRHVVERACALGMEVLVHDPAVPLDDARSLGAESVSWDRLLSSCDFISVHVSASPVTRGLIGDEAFERMRDRVRIVNCSRGGVVDEAALYRAVQSGRVAGAAVDIWDEGPALKSPLLTLPQVIVTPHIVASTFEAQINVAVNLAEQVRDYLAGGRAEGILNPEVFEPSAAEGTG